MKFTITSLISTQRIVEVLNIFGHDIDNNKPDFVITYGGDGTVLFSERKYPGVPKITIRAGNVGFKCIYSEVEFEDVLIKIDSGEYKLKEEIKLETTYQRRKYLSLNEAQLHNSSPIKAVRFSVYIEDEILFENVIGDGVVIATPFGSSAYYSSLGGKKFDKGIGIALNNPYNIKEKPVVIDEGFDYNINIKVLRDNGLLLFDNDNNMIKVSKGGDNIIVKRSKDTAKFVLI
jgi:NAD+ kinase